MRHFDMEMTELKKKLVDMASSVQQMIKISIDVVVKRDKELSKDVFSIEREVNLDEIVIDDTCLKLIALNQPVGSDLRFITSAMRINSDLERMGDEAVNICETGVELLEYPELKPLIDIPKMVVIVTEMVKESIESFNLSDTELAQKVLEKDDAVDELKRIILKDLIEYMIETNDRSTVIRAMNLVSIAKRLERLGDHATNICEDVIFMVNGKDIRHNNRSN
ncbi:MAG: phosphate signaling complex protein PhoU [Endomicrobiaceae bacterium]|jgi:phosphate transport system protein|nr:phosphate signaling complex protein PhoU [Endomicrobiaceae bacterium]MDD3729771.1 phosphate signaling complex protein PhoU [Endomicrobiaceae bacterium]MDD4166023.1 phosphate signaling complex protein PhoU [Endomicrobiaceae bacterium]